MAATKMYLNVPFSEKDHAKALGARWDAGQKKWYVLDDKDLSLFSQWQTSSAPKSTHSNIVVTPVATATKSNNTGTMTIAQSKNFIAYNGELPPWH